MVETQPGSLGPFQEDPLPTSIRDLKHLKGLSEKRLQIPQIVGQLNTAITTHDPSGCGSPDSLTGGSDLAYKGSLSHSISFLDDHDSRIDEKPTGGDLVMGDLP